MKYIDLTKAERDVRVAQAAELAEMPHNEQILLINKLYLNSDDEEPVIIQREYVEIGLPVSKIKPNKDMITLNSELERKRYSYYQQDLRKKRIENINEIITLYEITEKLVKSKLQCFYCGSKVLLFYKHVKEPYQWTLDRIDNTQAHTDNNTCIACLDCNLKRRNISHSGYVFTKKLSIRKLE